MPFDNTLRPPSTASATEHVNRLLKKGYYPINKLPRDSLLRIPWENGPVVSHGLTTGLPKVQRGTVDRYDLPAITHNGAMCAWGPVVYPLLWKQLREHANEKEPSTELLKRFVLDIARIANSAALQRTLLQSYIIAHLQENKDRAFLRVAIDSALCLLSKEESSAAPHR